MNRIVLTLMLLVLSAPAHADYFLWEDPKSGLTVTFPDTWKTQVNRHVDDVLTVIAPLNGDDAVCKIKTSPDSRYTIFPSNYGKSVQKVAVSIPFWQSYMANYDDYDIARVYDGGGLGRWIASYATASYTERDGTATKSRRAIMFASLYFDTLYVVECSALAPAYEAWERNFRSVIKSIDFKKIYHGRPTGDYADFLKKSDMHFWAQTGPEGTAGYN